MAINNDVRLNEMEKLSDLGLFPPVVCAGAVLNVLATIVITRLVRHSSLPIHLPEWIALVLALNLLPVVMLRVFTLRAGATFRHVREMSFVADQHKFPLWVYLLASLNMTTWVVLSWEIFARSDNPLTHLLLIGSAVVITAFPLWVRWIR